MCCEPPPVHLARVSKPGFKAHVDPSVDTHAFTGHMGTYTRRVMRAHLCSRAYVRVSAQAR